MSALYFVNSACDLSWCPSVFWSVYPSVCLSLCLLLHCFFFLSFSCSASAKPAAVWIGGELNCSVWARSRLSSPWDNEMTINEKAVAIRSFVRSLVEQQHWGRDRDYCSHERLQKLPGNRSHIESLLIWGWNRKDEVESMARIWFKIRLKLSSELFTEGPKVQKRNKIHPGPSMHPGPSKHPGPLIDPLRSTHPGPSIYPGPSMHPGPSTHPRPWLKWRVQMSLWSYSMLPMLKKVYPLSTQWH